MIDLVPDTAELNALAARIRYEGSAKHKERPRAFGLEPVARDADDTLCDGHAGFEPAQMAMVVPSLATGVQAGLLGHNRKADGVPTIIWTVWDTGWVFEARITNAVLAEYHGYPLLPSDAFARQIIARYREWVYGQRNSPQLMRSVRQAEGLYR